LVYELESAWKETFMTQFKIQSWNFPLRA